MAQPTDKVPPQLRDDSDYVKWKNDLEMWCLYTSLDEVRIGPAVFLAVSGKASDVIQGLKPADVAKSNGYKLIIKKLDEVYMKDRNTRAYLAFRHFFNYRRPSGTPIPDFVVEFEKLYRELKRYDMELPGGVLAFMILNAANITEDNERLARATVGTLSYDGMKEKIMQIFAETSESCNPAVPEIKTEVEGVFFSADSDSHRQVSGARRRDDRSQYSSRQFAEGWSRGTKTRGRGAYRGYNPGHYKPAEGRRVNWKENMNPVDRFGNPMQCHICQSIMHLQSRCPHNQNCDLAKSSTVSDVNITLHCVETAGRERDLKTFVHETLGMAVLDSGCTRTVAGEKWLEIYFDLLLPRQRAEVKYSHVKAKFRFGDGQEVSSMKEVTFPVVIGKREVLVSACVVENDIPLLLSKVSMKRAGMIMDFTSDRVRVLGEDIQLHCSNSGHYCLPLAPTVVPGDVIPTNITLTVSSDFQQLSQKQKKAKARKLHQQFAHASLDKLTRLIKNCKGLDDKEFEVLLKEVDKECDTCQKYKRVKPRPVVGMPLATTFNEVVCMDLKEYRHNQVWILHLIDSATRYSAATLIYTKSACEIVKQVFHVWIAYFGSPKKFLSDNGGEFANWQFREMNEKLNVETCNTAAESPFSNGIVERHNRVLYEAMKKTEDDTHCKPEIALAWSISAKNSLHNFDGFSPNQLVFGRNVNLPSVLSDHVPALDSRTNSDMIRENLNALHKAREAFIISEASEKVRRALRHQTRTYSNEVYWNGDKVFYRRNNFSGWKGPATVLGKDGQCVLVKHGSIYCRVHPCHLMKKVAKNVEDEDEKTVARLSSSHPASVVEDSTHGSGNVSIPGSINDGVCTVRSKEYYVDLPDSDNECENPSGCQEICNRSSVDINSGSESDSMNEVDVEGVSNGLENDYVNQLNQEIYDSTQRPKRNADISFLESGEWKSAKVLSQQPKKSSKYENWINVHVEREDLPRSVDWNTVEAWKDELPVETVLALSEDGHYNQLVVDAKEAELENLKSHDVYEEVLSNGQPTISTRWIITEKHKDGQQMIKARLVARGFEEDTSKLTKDSPTCSRESLRLLFTVASTMGWELQSLDISSAFLQGDELERQLFLLPPKDVRREGYVWKSKRCLYGLNDAPRSWYNRVVCEMTSLGATVSSYDRALFLWHDDMMLKGMLVSHVDDFAFVGTKQWKESVICAIKERFKISAFMSNSFKYLGLSVQQTSEEITLHQMEYTKEITPIPMQADRKKCLNEALNKDERASLKSLSGKMLWVTNQTRPDLSFESCMIANAGKSATVRNINEANKAVSKLKSEGRSIKFCGLQSIDQPEIVCYTDATHASLPDGASQGAYIILLKGKSGLIPISWQSKKLDRVTKSPIASEASALSDGADVAFYISCQLKEIFPRSNPLITCFTDNKSLSDTLKSTRILSDKRLLVDVARIKQMINLDGIKVCWIKSGDQLADSLTKRGASTERLVEALRM